LGNPGSTGYLVIQLFSSQLLGLCLDYSITPVILFCRAVVFNYLDLVVRPGSALGVLDRGTGHVGTLPKHMHYIGSHLQ